MSSRFHRPLPNMSFFTWGVESARLRFDVGPGNKSAEGRSCAKWRRMNACWRSGRSGIHRRGLISGVSKGGNLGQYDHFFRMGAAMIFRTTCASITKRPGIISGCGMLDQFIGAYGILMPGFRPDFPRRIVHCDTSLDALKYHCMKCGRIFEPTMKRRDI